MSKGANKKVYKLEEHSLAKIRCYQTYLEIYLNVLGNSPFKKIYLLDLFAGEGRDIDGQACSSIAALNAIKNHYDLNIGMEKCKNISVFFNDDGSSIIEENTLKIDRIKKFAAEFNLPQNITVTYSNKKFEDIIGLIIQRLNCLDNLERALCFIDPFGYKYSKPEILRDLMTNGKTEILLFIPICFMHRFSSKVLKNEEFKEGKHIEEFIRTLFDNDIPDIANQVRFIKSIQKQFKLYLNIPYVDVMYIEKEKGHFFALFFFSNSKKGFQKMLEAKWKVDENNGLGFRVNTEAIGHTLFNHIDHEDYTYRLYNEIKNKGKLSNEDIFNFGLNNNHLPKHSNKVLNELKREKKIKVVTESGSNAMGNYIDNQDQIVFFIPIN